MIANMPDGQLHLAWQKLSIPRKMSKDPGGSQCSQVGSGSEILRRKKKSKNIFFTLLHFTIFILSDKFVPYCIIMPHYFPSCPILYHLYVPFCSLVSSNVPIVSHHVALCLIVAQNVPYCVS